MTDEMLIAQAQWLPQYKDEVPHARQRLQGAARLHTKTVEEMIKNQVEARANASATDKGKMTRNS